MNTENPEKPRKSTENPDLQNQPFTQRSEIQTLPCVQLEQVNLCLIQLQLLLPSPSKELLGLFLEGIYKNNPPNRTAANSTELAAPEATMLLVYTHSPVKSYSTPEPSRTSSSCS